MNAGWYVRKENKAGGRVTVYGPFQDKRSARAANIFYRSNDEFSRASKLGVYGWENYTHVGVSYYSAEELESVAQDPGTCYLKSFKVKPSTALKIHADWKNSDREYLTTYYIGAK